MQHPEAKPSPRRVITGVERGTVAATMLELRRGYVTSNGDEYGEWPTLWIEDWEYVVDFQGRSYLVLYCNGGWGFMAAQRQYQWADDEATVWRIAERLFALAGFELSSQGEASTLIGTLKPAIVITPAST